jgi:hypothetical protein
MEMVNGGVPHVMTDRQGAYAFDNMPFGGIYDVVPSKSGDDLNGVSTADLVAIQRHLLGKNDLNSPYQLIAADINNSSSVTAADISELRKLILGVYTTLPNNSSWRFVDAEYNFPVARNPWKEAFPEKYRLEPFERDMDIDFIGVKVGDVNGDVDVDGARDENQTRSKVDLLISNRSFKAGDIVSVPFSLGDITELDGFQFTLEWDEEVIKFSDLDPNSGFEIYDANFGLHLVDEGVLTSSWHTTQKWFLPKGMKAKLFTLEFVAKKDGQLSENLFLSGSITSNEAYMKNDGQMVDLALTHDKDVSKNEFLLYQNKPNPWSGFTVIKVYMPEGASGVIQVFDESGRLSYKENVGFEAGYSNIRINRSKLKGSGVYFYKLQTDKYFATRRMIVID